MKQPSLFDSDPQTESRDLAAIILLGMTDASGYVDFVRRWIEVGVAQSEHIVGEICAKDSVREVYLVRTSNRFRWVDFDEVPAAVVDC